MNRLLLLALLLPSVVFCCSPLQNSSYRHAAHLSKMNLSIFYDRDFKNLTKEVVCRLENIFAFTNLYPLNKTSQMTDVCEHSQVVEKLRFMGLIQVTLTISRLKKVEAEAKCNLTANFLHFKATNKRWLAHLITRRSDFILDIGNTTNDSTPEGLTKALELMLGISGPVLTLPATGIYKTQHELEKKKKHEDAAWIKILVGASVGCLVAIAVTVIVVVGIIVYWRRVQRKNEKSQQLAKKTEVQEGIFTMDFGEENESQTETSSLLFSEKN